VSKFKEHDRESAITESVFINFKHTGGITFKISECMSYLKKDLFITCFVYLRLSQNIGFDK
jgi:hypothetical protein